jgi:hypothetical protein
MSEAMKWIVDGFVKVNDRQALNDLKATLYPRAHSKAKCLQRLRRAGAVLIPPSRGSIPPAPASHSPGNCRLLFVVMDSMPWVRGV